jgi:iron complex outermembrane receptor protein
VPRLTACVRAPDRHPPVRSRRAGRAARALAASALTAWAVAAQAAPAPAPAPAADDLTGRSLEDLLGTEVLSAARFARQVSDSASAVSVLTARDIRELGLRTLGEVLEQMRGLHLSADFAYSYLNARGYGGPRALAGRVMLLVDGVPAVDNLYDQVYLGADALVDASLIDRVEYAPGSGASSYGNNAFLGVINVITLRGRDLQGLRVSALAGAARERTWRATTGRREANGAEWLLSFRAKRDDGNPSADLGQTPWPGTGRAWQWFAKGQFEGWSAQWMGVSHTVATPYDATDSDRLNDTNQFVSVGHDAEPAPGWRTSLRWQAGEHRYDYRYLRTGEGGFLDDTRTRGAWWALDAQATWSGHEDHDLVVGLRLRRDQRLRYRYDALDGNQYQSAMSREQVSVSVEDRWRLRETLALTLGVRLDQRSVAGRAWSPRNALVWTPTPGLEVKWAQGMTTRFASAAEEGFGLNRQDHGERVDNRELGVAWQRDSLRLLATAYHWHMKELLSFPGEPTQPYLHGNGVELEGEWQARGWRLRGSHAWQRPEDDQGRVLPLAPRTLTKLQVSAPLSGERVRLSTAIRHVGPQEAATPGLRIDAFTRVDVTLLAERVAGPLDLRVGVRNLGGALAREQDEILTDPAQRSRRSRHAWIELSGSFR